MELKSLWFDGYKLEVRCFNRTFMELKLRRQDSQKTPCSGFNRTFMELKFRKITFQDYLFAVLIVPLWN